MIRAEGVFKIFGPSPQEGLKLVEQGKTKSEVREESGNVVGVNDASFELEAGEVFCIMGLSGSGKSTLIRCINRLIEPTAGKVFFESPDGDSVDITSADEKTLRDVRTNHMSMVFQHFGLFPHRTVLDNVSYGLEIQGESQDKRNSVSEEMLELVGLGGWGNAYPSELSGGMQQRVGLARGLAAQSEVMLMDEPFSALDPLIKINMQDELLKILDELEKTVLFITHDLDEAMRLGHRIAIMDAGVIVQIGTPEEILVQPKTEYVANFVENADPTGVLTAGTLALPPDHDRMSVVRDEGDGTVYVREGRPNVHYKVDREGRFQEMRLDDQPIQVHKLKDVLAQHEELWQRHTDVGLTVRDTAVIKDILRGRGYSRLPVVVLDNENRLVGVIGERELITGILEKTGPSSSL
ncbi:MAG: glycine betaine/L-proline ABC transporter ATP-binding protein, partial [Candidatus Bipolaricaulia bacterium]